MESCAKYEGNVVSYSCKNMNEVKLVVLAVSKYNTYRNSMCRTMHPTIKTMTFQRHNSRQMSWIPDYTSWVSATHPFGDFQRSPATQPNKKLRDLQRSQATQPIRRSETFEEVEPRSPLNSRGAPILFESHQHLLWLSYLWSFAFLQWFLHRRPKYTY